MKHRIKILIVDDHFIVRQGLRSIIREESDMVVCGEAANGEKALQEFEEHLPDVVVMDLRMPIATGVEATRTIRRKHPAARVLMLSSFDGDEDIHAALEAGAMGYLLKHSSSEQIVPAIRSVMNDEPWIPADVKALLDTRKRTEDLTAREREIIHWVAAGFANKQIADKFDLTEGTVKWHLKNIMGKLQVPDRTSAVTVALRRGIIQLP